MTQMNDNTSRFVREVKQLVDAGDVENVIVSYWFHDITVITKAGIRLMLPAKEGQQQIRKALNAITGEQCNMIEAGIIDPVKVVRVSLENAVSVASNFILTECVIVETE